MFWHLFDWQAFRKGFWEAIPIPPPNGPATSQLHDRGIDVEHKQDVAGRELAKLEESFKHWDDYMQALGVADVPPQYELFKIENWPSST